MFVSLQKYIVYGKDGVSLQLPILATPSAAPEVSARPITTPVVAEIVFITPDFGSVPASAGDGVQPVHAVYAETSDLSEAGINNAIRLMNTVGADSIVFDMKPDNGQLAWISTLDPPNDYGTNGTSEISAALAALKSEGIYLIAQISCFVDAMMSERGSSWALRDVHGDPFVDAEGRAWLDPYNRELRAYIIELMDELYSLGFDEILLTNVAHPDMPALTESSPDPMPDIEYSQAGVSALDITTAISNFALKVTGSQPASERRVSVWLEPSAIRGVASSGQDAQLFFKVFDRVVAANVERSSVENFITVGAPDARFVPVTTSAPDTGSWILIP